MSNIRVSPEGKVAFVSGSNRGIGKAITIELLEKGAKKVYAGARNPDTLNDLKKQYGDRLIPTKLDLTDNESIRKATENIDDAAILINNAGVGVMGSFFSGNMLESLNKNLEVNLFGLVKLTASLIDVLKRQPAAAIVNVSSIAGLANMPIAGTYSASKAAVHSTTQGMRAELVNDNILVAGVYPGPVDTDMARGLEMEKETPKNAAKDIIQGLIDGKEDIFPDPMSKQIQQAYQSEPKAVEKQMGQFVPQPDHA